MGAPVGLFPGRWVPASLRPFVRQDYFGTVSCFVLYLIPFAFLVANLPFPRGSLGSPFQLTTAIKPWRIAPLRTKCSVQRWVTVRARRVGAEHDGAELGPQPARAAHHGLTARPEGQDAVVPSQQDVLESSARPQPALKHPG